MPELPEVESTRAGLAPHLIGQTIKDVVLRRPDLRFPIPIDLPDRARGRSIVAVERRAKYLRVRLDDGAALIWHLGMSGVMRVVPADTTLRPHDHVDVQLSGGQVLRFNDPRRFGCLLYEAAGTLHERLVSLGVEPLEAAFTGPYLHALSRGRQAAVKAFVMDQAIVVGVGNIYAAEALFASGINPTRAAGTISLRRYADLVTQIRSILTHAIARGGTTLRDFLHPDGQPGYFEQELLVYGRAAQPCRRCGTPLISAVIAQRASVFCSRCQR